MKNFTQKGHKQYPMNDDPNRSAKDEPRPVPEDSPEKIETYPDDAGADDPETWEPASFTVAEDPDKTRFHDFDLPETVMRAIHDLGFTHCTPIQAEILPSTLAGRDAFGRAQTGTGKTAAFLISILTYLLHNPPTEKRKSGTPRVLILAPTRELVMQISEEARQLGKYTGMNIISIFGGMDFKEQQQQLKGRPVDIIVATPGRLLDFSRRRQLRLKRVEILVIDEADRMLDMGFIPDVRKIIYATPQKSQRQTMLFSATLTEAITRLAVNWTRNPVEVAIEPEQVTVDSIDQIVYITTGNKKFALLYNIIVQQNLDQVLIFCNRKDAVGKLADRLKRYQLQCEILTGDVPQQKRAKRLEQFKDGRIRVLVATDVMARGIHIEDMDHVINYDLPHDPEDYVHRIGRTGRAGAAGTSISFADEWDSFYIPEIEAYMERPLPCTEPDDNWLILPQPPAEKKTAGRKKSPRQKRSGDRKSGASSKKSSGKDSK